MRIYQIVPRLPPAIDGLGDYALHLAVELQQMRQRPTTFVVGDPAWNGPGEIRGFPTRKVRGRDAGALLEAMDAEKAPECAILHYVNYGYAKRGCPLWLVNALQDWVRGSSARRLITVFHELYADGPPWKSEFWLSSVQVHLARKLHRLSSVSMTSTAGYARTLAGWAAKRIVVMPVFSNVGEPAVGAPLADRRRMGVVFGGRESRRRVYERFLPELAAVCRDFELDEIGDIGPPLDLTLDRIGRTRLTQWGALPGERISGMLRNAVAGVFDYSPGHWAKSSIFAAYCAHGVVPVCMRPADGEADGITRSMYWLADKRGAGAVDLSRREGIAAHAKRWYRTHTRRGCAEKLAELLAG